MVDFTDVQEQKRIYYFPQGVIAVENIVKFAAPGTTHRLETADGKKFIVNNGWMAIELDVAEWSF
jgi:hypothetical protein